MKLLAIDTAGPVSGVGLVVDGRVLEAVHDEPRAHARVVLSQVEALLAQAGVSLGSLDAVAFGQGPGSFTGLRIAAGVAQGLALGAALPVIPVSSLAALALAAHRKHSATRVLAALDARMGEVYWGAYQIGADDLPAAETADQISLPHEVQLPGPGDWAGAGSAWTVWPTLGAPAVRHSYPGLGSRPADLLRLAGRAWSAGETLDAAEALPVYLREQVAKRVGEKGHGR